MFRILLLGIFGGGMLAYFGVQECRVGWGTSSQPESVSLAELEAGKRPANNHLLIQEHLAVFPQTVYSYSRGKYESGPPGPNSSVNYCYYPIISSEHVFTKQLKQMAEAVARGQEVEPNPLADFTVLVKTKRFSTIGAIPEQFSLEDQVQGLVVNQIASLKDDEKNLITSQFPAVNIDKVLILDDGRRPSVLIGLAMLLGGLVLSGGSVAGLFMKQG